MRLVTVAAIPLAYLLGHAAMLASEDRYAFPAQPLALATLAALTVRGLAAAGRPPWRSLGPEAR